MFLRLLWESFVRQRRRKALAGLAILLGVTAVTAMLALATTIGDRIHRELAVYGANIVVTPKADTLEVKIGDQTLKPATGGATLRESDLPKLRTIFWANNITGASPALNGHIYAQSASGGAVDAPGIGLWFSHSLTATGTSALIAGAPALHPLWRIDGAWPQETFVRDDASDIVLGSALAQRGGWKIGDIIQTALPAGSGLSRTYSMRVTGIARGDTSIEDEFVLPLKAMQILNDEPDSVSRIEVSARTKPEDAFARKDPATLSPKLHEIWYCRPYANSIAYQIEEAIPGSHAEQVRQVEQSEGNILARIGGLMWLISAAALLAAVVAVSAAMATAVLERRTEIGLMRSLGASRGRIASLFYAEAGLLAIVAGVAGYVFGSLLAACLTAKIFSGPAGTTFRMTMEHAFNPVLLPVVLAVALLVATGGAMGSIRSALRMDPSAVLRADA